jgi:hypothetical protein
LGVLPEFRLDLAEYGLPVVVPHFGLVVGCVEAVAQKDLAEVESAAELGILLEELPYAFSGFVWIASHRLFGFFGECGF